MLKFCVEVGFFIEMLIFLFASGYVFLMLFFFDNLFIIVVLEFLFSVSIDGVYMLGYFVFGILYLFLVGFLKSFLFGFGFVKFIWWNCFFNVCEVLDGGIVCNVGKLEISSGFFFAYKFIVGLG